MALARAGWEPVVYEAYEDSSGLDQGVFLTVAVNGLDALSAVGAADAVGDLGFPTGKIAFASWSGKELGAMDIGPRLPDGTVTRSMRRADLYAALHQLCDDRGIPIEHNKRLVDVTDAPDRVVAPFAVGSRASGSVLFGADGLRSTVRAVIDSQAPAPHYTGMGNVGGFTHLESIRPDHGDYRMIWGRRCFFGYTVSPDGEVWWFANPPSAQPFSSAQIAATTSEQSKARLIELLRGDSSHAADIVSATTGHILFGNQYNMPPVPTWSRGRVLLIGDAAHAVAPSTGQGVWLACEDAVTAALCLRDASDIGGAFARYEQLRRDRVERIAAWGAKMGSTKTTGRAARVVRDLVLPRILARGATPAAMEKQAWMFHHHIDWNTPIQRDGTA